MRPAFEIYTPIGYSLDLGFSARSRAIPRDRRNGVGYAAARVFSATHCANRVTLFWGATRCSKQRANKTFILSASDHFCHPTATWVRAPLGPTLPILSGFLLRVASDAGNVGACGRMAECRRTLRECAAVRRPLVERRPLVGAISGRATEKRVLARWSVVGGSLPAHLVLVFFAGARAARMRRADASCDDSSRASSGTEQPRE